MLPAEPADLAAHPSPIPTAVGSQLEASDESDTSASEFACDNNDQSGFPPRRHVTRRKDSDFSYEESRAYRTFESRDWHRLRLPEYVAIATILAQRTQLTIDRDSKRKKNVLFQWMEAHWDVLAPWVEVLQLVIAPKPN
jgi:hypothetical protein